MCAISLGDDGAELRSLEPWHAEEFLEHLGRGREFINRHIHWAFDERGMHRVEWYASSANEPSINVARRLGMTREGVLREAYPYRGVRQDIEVWSVLVPEWHAARARAERGEHQ
jgi:RimJ/RimL family protein N-acetyltransferase